MFFAAAQHGHEFSSRTASPVNATQSPAPRSPLSILSSAARQQRPSASPLQSAVKRQSSDGSVKPRKSIMFAIPPETTIPSRPVSIRSAATTSTADAPSSRKRSSRPKTIYSLAHPPPRVGPLHLRPRVLLQLHQSSAHSRPKPAYEALPSTTFAPRLKRKFHRVFKHQDRLGPDDVVIAKAAQYGLEEPEESDDDLESREVVGVVCANLKEEKTEICMDDDSVWYVTHMPNGGYEFVATDEHGLQTKARWVPRLQVNRRVSANFAQNGAQKTSAPSEDRKFNFSTISPGSRRHPVIASMTRASIDVWDKYIMPSPSLNSPLPSPAASENGDASDDAKPSPTMTTDEQLRKLIIVTGIWVAFRENWSPVFNYNRQRCHRDSLRDSIRDSITSSPCPSPLPFSPVRTVSMASIKNMTTPSRSSSPGIPDAPSQQPHRHVSRLLHRNHALAALSGDPGRSSETIQSAPTSDAKTRARAHSTGTAFMRRAHSKRNPKRHSSGIDMRGRPPRTPEILLNDDDLVLPAIEDHKFSGEYASTCGSSDGEDDDDSDNDNDTPRQSRHQPYTIHSSKPAAPRPKAQSAFYARPPTREAQAAAATAPGARDSPSAPEGLGLRLDEADKRKSAPVTRSRSATSSPAPAGAERGAVNGSTGAGACVGFGNGAENSMRKEKEKKGGVRGLLRRFRSKREKR